MSDTSLPVQGSSISVGSGSSLALQSGALVSSGVVESGGSLTVSGNAEADNVVVSSGGKLYVSSGGLINGTDSSDGGTVYVLKGGVSSDSIGGLRISAGGESVSASTTANSTIYVYKSGVASDTTIQGTSGIVRVSSGGEALDTTVKSGAYLWVSSGGYASGVTVLESGGYIGVSSGAVASDVTIDGGSGRISGYGEDYTLSDGAYIWISSGGILSNAVFDTNASAFMSNGATVDVVVVKNGATLNISAGAQTIDATVLAGGTQLVAGATVSSVISSGGLDILTSGATGSADIISEGGLEIVSAGATVSDETVFSGGELVVVAGASASGLVNSGGEIVSAGAILFSSGAFVSAIPLEAGDISSVSVISGLTLEVFSGVLIDDVQDQGTVVIDQGASAEDASVQSGASLDVRGQASGTIVLAGGVESVEAGAVSVDGEVKSGGIESVAGEVSGFSVEAAGSLNVSSGGVASGDTVMSGGVEIIWSGGSAVDETIASGATLVVMSGASLSGTVLEDGAKIISATVTVTSNGGIVDAAADVLSRVLVTDSEELDVYDGGEALHVNMSPDASATIYAGGVGSDVQGGTIVVLSGGLLTGGTETSGTYSHVSSGGDVSGVTIGSSAVLRIWAGGRGEDITVENGGDVWQHAGVLSHVVLENSGYLGVSAGASAVDVAIHGGSGRVAGVGSDYTLDDGGYVIISSGGVLDGATFTGSASANMSGGGLLENATVADGATIYVVNAAATSGVTVEAGGVQQVNGVIVSGTVGSGGLNVLSSGAQASGNVILSGGIEVVSSGAVASGEVVSAGGTLLVLAGATVTDTVSAGGNVVSAGVFLTSGAMVVSAVTGTMSGVVLDNVTESAVVLTGGELDSARLSSGAVLQILSGGLASGTDDASVVTVSAGAGASGTTVHGNYATQDVYGSAAGTVISDNGTEIVEAGASGTGETVQSGGTEKVLGSVTGVTTQSAGTTEFLSGASGSGDVVASGGFEIIDSGATVSGETVEAGGTLVLRNGATASDVTLESGAQILSAGVLVTSAGHLVAGYANVAVGLDIEDYGESAEILSGGGVESAVIGEGTVLTVSSGAIAVETQVAGDVEILSGGVAAGTTVSGYGAVEAIRNGGVASGTQILTDATQFVSSGGAALDAVVSAGGAQIVSSGGAVSGTEIGSGGRAEVHGVIAGGTVDDGGVLSVLTGGVASGDTLDSGAIEIVSSGATAENEVVSSGATLIVLDGGSATDIDNEGGTVVTSGMVIWSGTTLVSAVSGIASGVVLDSTRTSATVQSGGAAKGTTVTDGAILTVASGAVAVSDVVTGLEDVQSGGGTDLTLLLAGSQTVEGVASRTVVGLEGTQVVNSGGVAADTVVLAGGAVSVSGALSGGQVRAGGLVTVQSGGVAVGDTISSGGIEIVSSGATVLSETVLSGGMLVVLDGGTVEGITGSVISSGEVFLDSNGNAVSATADALSGVTISGAVAAGLILSGGGMIATTVASDCTLEVGNGGIAAGSIVSGDLRLDTGAGASQTVLVDGGTETIGSGAIDANAEIDADSFQNVIKGGVAVSAHILSDGVQSVYGLASNTVIDGGTQTVYGTTLATVIGEGGEQIVVGGATSATITAANAGLTATGGGGAGNAGYAGNVEIESGGVQTVNGATSGVVVDAGGSQTIGSNGGGVAETIAGQVLVSSGGYIQESTVQSGGLLTLADGASADDIRLLSGGMIDLSDIVYGSNVSLSLSSGFELVVTNDDTTVTIDLDGAYTLDQFALGADAAGDTLLTVVQDGTPCYGRGTLIRTPRGETPVEDLAIGDLVETATNGPRPVRWIGRRAYSGQFAHGNRDVLPVIFRKGSLGDGLPHTDLSVSPLHAMFIDGLLLPAAALANGESILQAANMDEVKYFHIELETHDIIFANGAPSETFIDDESRGMFHNAAEYAALYPQARKQPAIYCAPRVEQGAVLEEVRRRLAVEAGLRPASVEERALSGFIDTVTRTRISGWARTDGGDRPVRLRILDRGAVIGELVADLARPDLGGNIGFSFEIPGGLTPYERHVIEVRRASDQADLGNGPWVLDQTSPTRTPRTLTASSADTLEGYVDIATRDRIGGWAWDSRTPEDAVGLQILDNGLLIAATVANGHRPDVAVTGRAERCGFDVWLTESLAPFTRHVIEVRREKDGALLGAPVVIEAVTSLDPEAESAISRVLAAAAEGADGDRVLSFLLAQVDRVARQRNDRLEDAALERQRQTQRRQGHHVASTIRRPRALVIDGLRPDAGRDAGSCAVLSHMRALTELGYDVSFVAADDIASGGGLETAPDTSVLSAPFYASVEDVLRKHAESFDLVYLHREEQASRYIALVRRFQKKARVVYSMADLHFLRMARQAVALQSPELAGRARLMKQAEYAAISRADTVLVHSRAEAALIRRELPMANVHVVSWEIQAEASYRSDRRRKDVVFLGNYAHTPNIDAARWLAEDIAPRVRLLNPDIRFVLAGAAMPGNIKALACENVRAVGHVACLDELFATARLSIAPLRFGAGIKGKVLESLARGVPCVMTPLAAEGLELDERLASLVAESPELLSRKVVDLYSNRSERKKLSDLSVAGMISEYGADCVIHQLGKALHGLGDRRETA